MTIKTKKIISNILFYIALAVIYGIAALAVISKFNGGAFYFGDTRLDVVLTSSMATRNKEYEDFLKDTSQIQRHDLIVSSKIKEDTKLEVKDCVLFRNPKLENKLVVHRIVAIEEEGISFNVRNAEKVTFDNVDVVKYRDYKSEISMMSLDFTSIEIVAYSPEEYAKYYTIVHYNETYETSCVTTKISDYVYKHVITYQREAATPTFTKILKGTEKEVYLASVKYVSNSRGALVFNASDLVVDENYNYHKYFDSTFRYAIRGDANNALDGWFTREKLIAKTYSVVPKIGIVILFLQSIPGLICVVGLGIIITAASYFWNKSSTKAGAIEDKPVEETVDLQNIDNVKEEESGRDKESKQD